MAYWENKLKKWSTYVKNEIKRTNYKSIFKDMYITKIKFKKVEAPAPAGAIRNLYKKIRNWF